ncbi:MAG: AAA-like domain-containing protein [Nitrospira sp.]|nr:AAA-like domain-containing protein [Nitrospira sp.]
MSPSPDFPDPHVVPLQVGGTLIPGEHLYVRRPEDEEVFKLILTHDYVNILASRQVGKSSLFRQIEARLIARGWHTAGYDLSEIGSPQSANEYFKFLIEALVPRLNLFLEVDKFWAQWGGESPSQRLVRFFRDVVLTQLEGSVAVFLDEIDSTLKFPYTDDLFTALRAMYNERPVVKAYRRLVFCLIGVATPDELIKDRRTTPYNVGQTVWLGDFDSARDDLSALVHVLHQNFEEGKKLLKRVLHWTQGHPFLTLSLCKKLGDCEIKSIETINDLVATTYSSLDSLGENGHIQQMLRFLDERLTDGSSTLQLYQCILNGKQVKDRPSLTYAELKLSGLVRRNDRGCLVVRNPIYERLFDRTWIRSTRPVRTSRRYRGAIYAVSFLLAGSFSLGSWYYFEVVRPQQSVLVARQMIESHGGTLSRTEGGKIWFLEFALGTTDADFLRAAMAIRIFSENDPDKLPIALDLTVTKVRDLGPVAGLTALQALDLSNTPVQDLGPVARLTALQRLNMSNTPVQDLRPVVGLTNLEMLEARETKIHDATVLQPLRKLHDVTISNATRDPVKGIDVNENRLSRFTDGSPLSKFEISPGNRPAFKARSRMAR